MGCKASRSADAEVESFQNHVDELELLGVANAAVGTRTRNDPHIHREPRPIRLQELERGIEREQERRSQRQRQRQRRYRRMMAVARNRISRQNQSRTSLNRNTTTTANLISISDLSALDLDRRRHWLDEVDHWNITRADLEFDRVRRERDNPFFLRRELIPTVPVAARARSTTTTGGDAGGDAGGNGDGDNNNNNNSNDNDNNNENSDNMEGNAGMGTDLPTNGEQLDQLRSDLVTLERLFHTLLGQRLADGSGSGPGGIPMIPTSPSSTCPPAARRVVDNLPTIPISEYDFEDDCNNNRECSICFLEHEVDDRVTRLPCGHFFHGECINEWLKKRCTCPICRWELETDDPLFELERVERMKSRRIRVKDHELDRLCIGGLQEMAGLKNVKNRAKLIRTIKNSKDIDIITKDKTRPQSRCKEVKVRGDEEEEKEEIRKKTS